MGGSFLLLEPMKIDIRERFLRIPEIVHTTGMSRTIIYDRINEGKFPKQIPLGSNRPQYLSMLAENRLLLTEQ